MKNFLLIILLLSLTTVARTQNKSNGSANLKKSRIPNPTIYTCNQDGEFMFKGCQGVRGDIKNWKVEGVPVKIKKFTITIAKKSGDTVVIENLGAYYETAAKTAFSILNIGDKVMLSGFLVTVGNENIPRKLTQVLSSQYSGEEYEFRY